MQQAETIERRQAGSARMAFDAQVDVGGATMAAFEANAIDVSREGLHLISPVLPELGQPLSCRFSVGDAEVICEGNVVWRMENANGGHEFGIRFSALDSESSQILSSLLAAHTHHAPAPATRHSAAVVQPGARVRLHIEGLGAPMRARVRDAKGDAVQAHSELGFLQLGKELQLEDAATGHKRSARIDLVEVEVDPGTQVPQLVVNLAYVTEVSEFVQVSADPRENTEATAPDAIEVAPAPQRQIAAAATSASSDELVIDPEIAEESARMKSAFATTMAKITPAVMAKSQKAYAAMREMWAKRSQASNAEGGARRVTAPPPGGGVVSKTRRATRGPNSTPIGHEDTPKDKAVAFAKTHKRKLVAGGAITAAALLAGLALGQSHDEKPLATAPVAESADISVQNAPVQNTPIAPIVPVVPVAQNAQRPTAMNPSELPLMGNGAAMEMEEAAEDEIRVSSTSSESARPKRVARPFGRGKIERGKAFRLKMDGPIEDIQGAQLPEGFSVTMPQRRSLEGAATLFKSDPRVSKAKVDNTSHGAELEVTFKDGTPGYVVRARGDYLEIVLSNPEKVGKATEAQAKSGNGKSNKNDKKTADKHDKKKKGGGIERASLKSRRKR